MPHVDELHTQHDPILMVALASGDLAPADRDYATAQSLLTSCTECARLHDDVIAIARATKVLPPVARTRDFRITDEQAAKLRPGGLRGLLGRLASGPLLSRQLGAGLATLGLAGLLVTAGPTIPLGGFASSGAAASQPPAAAQAPEYESLQSDGAALGAQPAASPAPSLRQPVNGVFGGGPSEAPAATDFDTSAGEPTVKVTSEDSNRDNTGGSGTGSAAPSQNQLAAGGGASPQPLDEGAASPPDPVSNTEPSVLGIVSAVLLATGVLLLIARRFARRTTSA